MSFSQSTIYTWSNKKSQTTVLELQKLFHTIVYNESILQRFQQGTGPINITSAMRKQFRVDITTLLAVCSMQQAGDLIHISTLVQPLLTTKPQPIVKPYVVANIINSSRCINQSINQSIFKVA